MERSGPTSQLRVVAWESTVACNLACVHCRASAQTEPAPGELTTAEVKGLIDDIASFAKPILIISGGEPLMRSDVFQIARYASDQGLHVAMSPNGTLITDEVAGEMVASGVMRVSISVDGSTAELHDRIRGLEGAQAALLRGAAACQARGVSLQFNTTVMRQNLADLPDMHRWVVEHGAEAWHVFMLVPTGRGEVGDEITPDEYEDTLRWIHETSRTTPVPMRVTCGPQFTRIVATSRREPGNPVGLDRPPHGAGAKHGHHAIRGCMAGDGYAFVSHEGNVCPCGYLPLVAGSIRERPFSEIYQGSKLFQTLRDVSLLRGKCGTCEYARVCRGCRARAYGTTGDYMAEDPICAYQPHALREEAC